MAPLVYLDVCCLNRPFDDQRQPRIRLEAEAVREVLLTTDDRFMRRAARLTPPGRVRVLNPITWATEELTT